MAFNTTTTNSKKGFFSKFFTKDTVTQSRKGAFKLQLVFIVLIVVCIIAVVV